MKKKLGALVLTLTSLVISAACASSRTPSRPQQPPQMDAGETWSKAGPSELPTRPARAAALQAPRLAAR